MSKKHDTIADRAGRMVVLAEEISVASANIRNKAKLENAQWGECPHCGKRCYMCCGSCNRTSPIDSIPVYCDKVGTCVSPLRRCTCWQHFDCPNRHLRSKD